MLLGSQTLECGDGYFIEILGLVTTSFSPGAPPAEVNVVLETSRGWITTEPDASGAVAVLAQQLSKRGQVAAQGAPMSQSHNVGTKAIPTSKHGAIAWSGGNVRTEGIIKHTTAGRQLVYVGGSESVIAIEAHMIRAQAVDSQYNQMGLLGHYYSVPLLMYRMPN